MMGAEHRKSARRSVEQPVLIRSAEGTIIGQCTMLDVSPGGARLTLEGDVAVPELFTLLLSKLDGKLKRHCVVSWRKDSQVGVRFVTAEDFVSSIIASA
jgi:PilZ domain